MARKKFSISLDADLLDQVDKFASFWNKQYIVGIDRAKAIRIIIRIGLSMQDHIAACHLDESEWSHLKNGTKAECGMSGMNDSFLLSLEAEEQITCPKCRKLARHHPKKSELFLQEASQGSSQEESQD